MSDKKFNLKDYVKINGDIPIGSRLMEEHGNIPNDITEKQLDKDRVEEKQVTIEKLLDESRTGGADMLTEGRLNSEKSKISKYRNPEAYKGNINKVEERRLASDPVEKEKYSSTEIPKKLRWWEEKSPDGLKIASNKALKTAQLSDLEEYDDDDDFFAEDEVEELSFDKSWEVLPEVFEDEEVPVKKGNPLLTEDFPVVEDENTMIDEGMKIEEQKVLTGPLPGIRMRLSYDPETFDGDKESIRDAALEAVIDARPQLAGLISTDDFYDINEEGDKGSITLKAIGDEFAAVDETVPEESPLFTEVSYSEDEAGGTPIVSGTIKIGDQADKENIIRDVIDFINDKHPRLNITEEALDLSKVDSGIVSFMKSPLSSSPKSVKTIKPNEVLEDDFAIEEVGSEEIAPDITPEPVLAQSNLKKK